MTQGERIELGDSGWEEREPGVLYNKDTGQKIDVATRSLYDAEGNFIKTIEVEDDNS